MKQVFTEYNGDNYIKKIQVMIVHSKITFLIYTLEGCN